MRQARSVVALHKSATFFAPLGVLRLVLCLALPPLHAIKGGLLAQPAHPLEGGLLAQPLLSRQISPSLPLKVVDVRECR